MVPEKFAQVRQEAADRGIEFVDLKSLDLNGRLHHISLPFERFTPDICSEGIGFDGSSYGFRKVENSDMVLIPDLGTAMLDPFRKRPTLHMFASAHLTDRERTPFAQDGRHIARKAAAALQRSGVADASHWGPEYEFYIFAEADFASDKVESFYAVESQERFSYNAYHACNPFDLYDDFRDEVCRLMQDFQIPVRYHHHEVGAHGQQEIEGWFAELLSAGDHVVLVKYILHNAARQAGLRVTFMPKPLYENAGNGFHLHQFLTKDGKNVFDDPAGYANLSQIGLYYVGGILAHADALCALTNPSTNSYKRLVPGFEAPVMLAYSARNRSASIRIPWVSSPKGRRIEVRFPDSTANPYFAFAALLMAGLDGIQNKLHPGEAADKDLYDLPPEEAKNIPEVCYSLDEALRSLDADRGFLTKGGVFTDDMIDAYIGLKQQEMTRYRMSTHPVEFDMYYSL